MYLVIYGHLRSRCRHYIFVLWFLLLSFFFLFLAESQPSQIGCLPYFHTWCGLSAYANLECMSEMCCTRLRKYRTQKIAQKLPSGHHRTTLSSYIFATKAYIDNQKKNLLNSNISYRCPHNMADVGPLVAEIRSGVWGTPANFSGFRTLASLLQ